MNWWGAGAIFLVGNISGVGVMIALLIRGHENARKAVNRSPEDR